MSENLKSRFKAHLHVYTVKPLKPRSLKSGFNLRKSICETYRPMSACAVRAD